MSGGLYAAGSPEPPEDVVILVETGKNHPDYLHRVGPGWAWSATPGEFDGPVMNWGSAIGLTTKPCAVHGTRAPLSPELRQFMADVDDLNRKDNLKTPRGTVLADATDLIHGDRNRHYGAPTENFDRIAAFWNIQLANKLKPGASVSAGDVADLMIAVKLARQVNQPKRDNAVDIAGYAACGWEAREAQ